MLSRKDIINLCLEFPFVYEDYPFGDDNWTLMRHNENKKSFAMIFERQDKMWINVKSDPAAAEFWQNVFPAVVPAYHMNKKHWISIIVDGSMSVDDIRNLIGDSYRLTSSKRKNTDL